MKFDQDAFEAAGHDLACLSGPIAGQYTYSCEKCACVVISSQGELSLFHAAPDSPSSPGSCPGSPLDPSHVTLKAKLELRQQIEWNKMHGMTAHPMFPHCPVCQVCLDYLGEPHDPECGVREVMSS